MGALIILPWSLALPASASPVPPQPQQVLRVATRIIEPLVVEQGDMLTGFSIDLWREVARRAGLKYQFVKIDTLQAMLRAVEYGYADVAIAAISMTPEREARLDFAHSYYQSGLQIMAPIRKTSFLRLLSNIPWLELLGVVGGFCFLVLIAAHAIWLVERGHNPDFPKSYLRGVGEGIWWAVVTVLTVGYGDRTPKQPLGRGIAILWMFTGLFLVAQLTATISARLTLQGLQGHISGFEDLPGKRIVTIAGTTADRFLTTRGIEHDTVRRVKEAYTRLQTNQSDAFVYDAPILNYYASHAGKGKVRVVGELLQPDPYGIALPQKSPYREAINIAVLELYIDGTHQQLTQRWFSKV
ncbi:MAG: transporter substrate-binding domain-containing protein [Pseudanabaenaceae cyanobacterium SKYG29]|nr:transporter substrate-binding domain-containing protein [Pseudanabaenaceae cyanobacterium SKYG29]